MGWLSNNWIWILLAVGFIAFYLFGHGRGHGGHGRPAPPRPGAGPETEPQRGADGPRGRRRRGGC